LAHWIWTNERDDPAGAIREFELGLHLSPNDANAYHAYGIFLASSGRREDAIRQYRLALLRDPLSSVTRLALAWSLERLGRPEDAYVEYLKLEAANPDFHNALASRASIEVTLHGRFVTALPRLYQAVEHQKANVFNLALFYLQVEDLESAAQLLEWAESQNPAIDFIEYVRAKFNWIRLGAAAEGFEALSRYLPGEPWLNEGRRLVAGILHLQRNHDLANGRAKTALRRYEEQFPSLVDAEAPFVDEDTVMAAVDLALVYQHLGEPARARALAQSALEATQGLERMGTYGYRLADVQALAIMGEAEQALERLETALDRGYREAALYQMKHDPNLSALHAEPKFQALLHKVEQDISDQRREIARLQSSGELMTLNTLLALLDGPSVTKEIKEE
jgi:tetratricopeptide (TPR) repeat protein